MAWVTHRCPKPPAGVNCTLYSFPARLNLNTSATCQTHFSYFFWFITIFLKRRACQSQSESESWRCIVKSLENIVFFFHLDVQYMLRSEIFSILIRWLGSASVFKLHLLRAGEGECLEKGKKGRETVLCMGFSCNSIFHSLFLYSLEIANALLLSASLTVLAPAHWTTWRCFNILSENFSRDSQRMKSTPAQPASARSVTVRQTWFVDFPLASRTAANFT